MAVSTRDNLIAGMALGARLSVLKASVTTVAGRRHTMYRQGPTPNPAASPATAAGNACLKAGNVSALQFVDASPASAHVMLVALSSSSQGTVQLVDRLVETGALSGIVTTAQAVGSVALPARAGLGVGVELWLECHTTTGATASASVSATYTSAAGATGRTATMLGGIPASWAAGQKAQMTLQAGDTGVQSVQSVTSTVSTGTAGAFGVTLQRPVSEIPITLGNVSQQATWDALGLPFIADTACLVVEVESATTSSGLLRGTVVIGSAS